MGHMARTRARGVSRIVALGATLVMATAGSTMAEPDTGELPVTGFTHTSLVDGLVESTTVTIPTSLRLADVYAWLASADRADGGTATRVGESGQRERVHDASMTGSGPRLTHGLSVTSHSPINDGGVPNKSDISMIGSDR